MINVIEGDITAIPCNALATCINSEKVWFGGVDRAIMRSAGNGYHAVAASLNLSDGDIVWVPETTGAPPNGRKYWDVIFVVDDQQLPTATLVQRALEKAIALADGQPYTLNLPAFRTGMALGVAEHIDATLVGIVAALQNVPENLTVNLVIYNDQGLTSWFRAQLELRPNHREESDGDS